MPIAILNRILHMNRSGNGRPVNIIRHARTAGYEPYYHDWGRQFRDLPPFSFLAIQEMLKDPTICLGLAMRAAPLCGVEFAYQQNQQWQSGVAAQNPAVGAFVWRQLRRIWDYEIDALLSAQIWGWSAGEITYRLGKNNLIEIDRLLIRHANDVRVRVRDGQPVGVRVLRIKDTPRGLVDLDFPKTWWHSYLPEPGRYYGDSVLLGAYSPWFDKWMEGGALDVRRLFMHKDAYGGVDITYPEGTMNVPNKGEVPNRDIAREIAEQITAGGVTVRPGSHGPNGEELWKLTRATVPTVPTHILQYPKDLDNEILRGLEIPDDVLSADSTGAWAGKRVPMAAFYSGLDRWLNCMIRDLTTQVLEPLVRLNFGTIDFEVTFKPLAEQAMEQQGQAGQGQQPEVGEPGGFGARMNLDPIEAVGRGVLDAGDLVQAARQALRMAGDGPKPGDTKIENGRKYVFSENHRWERAAGFASPNIQEGMSFEKAMQSLGQRRHREMKRQFEEVDSELSLTARSVSVVGDWGDGAEDSVITEYTDYHDIEELRYAMAWKGKIAQQKATLLFAENDDGEDFLYWFDVDDTIEGVREQLSKHGIDYRSVGRTDRETSLVYVVDFGRKLKTNIKAIGTQYGTDIQTIRGTADEIGVDASQNREDAQREYDRIIEAYEKSFPTRRHYRRRQKLARTGLRASTRRAPNRPVIIGIARRPSAP